MLAVVPNSTLIGSLAPNPLPVTLTMEPTVPESGVTKVMCVSILILSYTQIIGFVALS